MSQCVFFAHSTVLHHGILHGPVRKIKNTLAKGFHTALRTSTTRNGRLIMKSFFYYIFKKNVKSELWYKVSLWKITCGTDQTYITLLQPRITFINRNGNPADFIWNHPQMPLSFEKCLYACAIINNNKKITTSALRNYLQNEKFLLPVSYISTISVQNLYTCNTVLILTLTD